MTIGTCSLCGGRVSVPDMWGGIIPPVPTCESCGAHPKEPWGDTIPMAPVKPLRPMDLQGITETDTNEWQKGKLSH